jgi:Carboxypeptidase regulatory-like domain/TonB-dependent Receptor Plug Domain
MAFRGGLARYLGSFVAALLIFTAIAAAQTSNGTIVGVVTDKSGGAVANVTISITSIERGGDPQKTATDASGSYRLQSLQPGKYTVSFQAGGFAPTVFNNVDVRASLETNVSAVLEVTSTTTTVTVEASTGQELETQSGTISGNLSSAEIKSLPYLSGNPLELLLTEPGVQDVANRDNLTNGQAFSVNGARPRANNFLLDGQDNNDNQIAGQAVQTVNHEAIGEVTIIENSASAEFGRGGGAIANEVYRGGTNAWHGAGWDIIQPSALAAIDASLPVSGITRQPVQITNTFGFSLGGPIKKNKLFFFATPQWSRFRANAGAQATTILLPTANGVAALKQIETNEGDNPNIDYLLAAIGNLRGSSSGIQDISAGVDAGGNPRPTIEFGNLIRGDTSIASNSVQWSLRLDYDASDRDRLTLRVLRGSSNLFPDFFNNPGELPAFETQQSGPFSNYHASWTHTISSKMVNELRFSYGNIQFSFAPAPATLASAIGTHYTVNLFDENTPLFGLPNNEPASRNHQTYQFQDAFSWSFGKHTLKFGGDMALVFVKDGIPVDPRGTITVDSGGTCGASACTDLANYIDNFTGNGGSVTKFFGNNTIQPFAPNYAPYIQDTWRVTQNFTLDLGLRYEYWGTPENNLQYPAIDPRFGQGLAGATFPSVFSAQEQGDKNNFAPRVGLAYTPHFWPRIFGSDKTVIRAGYGIFYDGLFTNILDNTAGTSPNGISQQLTSSVGRGIPDATGALASLQPVLNSTSSVDTILAHLLNPITHQWNLNIERALPGGFLLTAAYVGTRGEHLFVNTDMNPFEQNTNFGFVTARSNGGDSIYHAGELKMERSFSHGLLLRGAYTYSKFIDDMSEVFTTSGTSSYAANVLNQRSDRGLSAFDRRNRFTMAYLYELPYVHSRDNFAMNVLNAITSGWQTSGTITLSSGAPQTINSGLDINGDGHSNDRPNLGNPNAPFTSTGFDGFPFGLSAAPGTYFPVQTCFFTNNPCNPAPASSFHFLIPASGNGNIGRNTFISPGFQFWNMSVQRTVKLKERYSFMIRGEFYNAFNHPNLGIPTLQIVNSKFDDEAQTINGGRTVVLWGKFSF